MHTEPKTIREIVRLIIAGVAVSVVGAEAVSAEESVPPNPKRWEECYGVAKAHQNDCASSDGRHGCGGASTIDGDPTEWMYVPRGYCSKLVGGVSGKIVRAKKIKVTSCTKNSKPSSSNR